LELLTDPVNRAFSKQSIHYDENDESNLILRDLRKQVYDHVDAFVHPRSEILELNAGTGIDALRLVHAGHRVHAIDVAEGMIAKLKSKIQKNSVHDSLTCELLSYTDLHKIKDRKFDYVFSNFGGLNCIDDLKRVTSSLPALLNDGAFVTLVIMPPYCLWELSGILRGSPSAFRRLKKDGTKAHLEGEYFQTYYHSLKNIVASFGADFSLVRTEGLAALSPPPHRPDIPAKHPKLYSMLRRFDNVFRNAFPFNRCADHIIVTFRYR
jgi:ubiquinone/menaquinone biosynthesis C-methylase UbiE